MPSSGSEIAGETGEAVPTEVTEQPPAAALSESERAAAFRRSEPKVPRNFALVLLAVFAVLGLGGALGEHLLSNVGLNPGAVATTSTIPASVTRGTAVIAPPASPSPSRQVGAALPAFMGMADMAGGRAPAFSLVDQSGRSVSLADERGRAVVVTFFDSPCQDICPVLSADLLRAATDLGPQVAHVAFVTINTDPVALSAAPASAAARTGLGTLPNWHFLTSSLGNLNSVWKAYGVSVTVSPTTGLVAHNDVMYFIDPAGRLRYRATPFADESASGAFSLSPADVARWGQGIATYTRRLLGRAP
ncbi:MAG TPA: SCO family protein [Acidimicrobiales bacterium]|nr:SCO family protein [Acidimicrobiales bacterium]